MSRDMPLFPVCLHGADREKLPFLLVSVIGSVTEIRIAENYDVVGIAQALQQLATGWTVWGSNPVGARFYALLHICFGPHLSLLCDGYRSISRGKAVEPQR